MYIVPSGSRRLSKFQQVAQPPTNPSSPKPRTGIEQEEIGGMGLNPSQPSQSGGEFNPLGQLGNTLDQQKQNPTQTSNSENQKLDQSVESNPGVVNKEQDNGIAGKDSVSGDNGEVVDGGSIKIKQALDKLLIELGVPQRKLVQHDKRRFQYNKKQQSGYFEIPERTGGGQQIGEDAVDKICKQLEGQFNIESEPIFQGGIWKVTFSPRVVEQQEMASSWDEGVSKQQSQVAKSAFSKNSLIKESHNSLIDSLIKQGFGVKNAS